MALPTRVCARAGCSTLVPKGYCPAHDTAKKDDTYRGSARERGYDRRWDVFSKAWLARFPWCGQRLDGKRYDEHSRCVQAGIWTLAKVTDHIIPMSKGGAPRDEQNSQSLCVACNVAKGDK